MNHLPAFWMAGLATVAVLVALWLLLRAVARRSREVEATQAARADRAYRCPDCGLALEPGWVMLGKGAIWRDRHQSPPGLFAHIGDALPNTLSFALTPAANLAWRCPRCRILQIDYSCLVRPPRPASAPSLPRPPGT